MDARQQLDGMPPLKRPKNKKEAPATTETDRISDLPEALIHHLMSLMPAHDAMRTGALNRLWRHLWMSAPAIRFSNDNWPTTAKRFNEFVDNVLGLRRDGEPVHSCNFDIEETELYSSEFVERHLSVWIWLALRRQVRVLRILLRFDDPVSIRNVRLFSQHLTKLELECLNTHEGNLDFSDCPRLVDLTMVCCSIESVEMSSSSLKRLKMIGVQFEEYRRTRMSLPNLVSLELDNIRGRVPLLESMPSLATAKVGIAYEPIDRCAKGGSADCGDDACCGCWLYYSSEDYLKRQCVILRGLSQATDLELSAYPDMFVFKRDLEWSPTFSNLKTLVLNEWFVTHDFSALIWFLQHSPVLEKLTLQITQGHKVAKQITGRYGSNQQSVASDRLELVVIKCLEVGDMVVAALKILHASGIPLEKIQFHKQSCFGWIKFVCTNFNPNRGSSYTGLWI